MHVYERHLYYMYESWVLHVLNTCIIDMCIIIVMHQNNIYVLHMCHTYNTLLAFILEYNIVYQLQVWLQGQFRHYLDTISTTQRWGLYLAPWSSNTALSGVPITSWSSSTALSGVPLTSWSTCTALSGVPLTSWSSSTALSGVPLTSWSTCTALSGVP